MYGGYANTRYSICTYNRSIDSVYKALIPIVGAIIGCVIGAI